MRAGLLRHRLTLQSPTTAALTDTGNVPAPGWQEEGVVWGSVEPLSVKESLVAQQVEVQATHLVRIRYNEALKQTWRIVFRGRNFEVESIIVPESRRIEMRVLVKETP